MRRVEGGTDISRRTFIRRAVTVGVLAAGAGGGAAWLWENRPSSPEQIDSQGVGEIVSKSGLTVVNAFLDNGTIKNKNVTRKKPSFSADKPPRPLFTFTSVLFFENFGVQVADFHPEIAFVLQFRLYKDDYDKIMADSTLKADQKNQQISQKLIDLSSTISINEENNSHAVLYNEMQKDKGGNWTNTSLHYRYAKTTNPKELRLSSRYKPIDKKDLRMFGEDVTSVLATFQKFLPQTSS